ncbi:tobamovirus multiplication protein 1-like isoform x1 [Anaeramoeba ignava]|uniref:Tobamovirus multiplication protein 1-like isoform x1 n=1 Tax=Anaeramoeba ignava TaxID=1746090 RepID=A0A9Q0LIP8_ANAIG|nr:tobamovirus multiplication protein 1-like isoform x1 [Anaeramoeba ignava]
MPSYIKNAARGASGTNSPQLYILGIIYIILALLIIYEIIRTIKTTKFTIYSLYLAKTLYLSEARVSKTKKYLDLILIIILVIMLILMILLCYFDTEKWDSDSNFRTADVFNSIYSVAVLLFLCSLMIFMGVKYYKQFKSFSLVKIRKKRIQSVMILIIIDGSIFFAHGIWSFFTLLEENKLNDKLLNLLADKEYSKYDTICLFWFIITEIIPALVLFIVLHHNLSSERSMFEKEENFLLVDPDFDYDNHYTLFEMSDNEKSKEKN